MADHTAQTVTTATTGVPEIHHEPSAFGISAPGFVALSMVVVIAIMIWQKVPGLIANILDARIATIRRQLDEASALRAEAEAMLVAARIKADASAGDAAAMIAHAESEAKQLLADAEAHATELTIRRGRMAEDKIGAAERAAIADVRTRAAAAAATVAAKVIAQTHDATADRAIIDQAIARLN